MIEPSMPSSSTVPSDGLVVTPLTKLPISGIDCWMVSLMPSADHVTVASRFPMVPRLLPSSATVTSSMTISAFMPLASRRLLPAVVMWIPL
jgi:hypothetical protein